MAPFSVPSSGFKLGLFCYSFRLSGGQGQVLGAAGQTPKAPALLHFLFGAKRAYVNARPV